MTKKEKAAFFIEALEKLYPAAECALKYEGEPYRLLVMAVLSAQCTDKRVNEVSVPLFEAFPTPRMLAESKEGELEAIIRPVGLYNSKAKNLRSACLRLCEVYGGVLPKEMNELLTLPGVGRKVANLLRGDIYNLGGIVADTHCIRISSRLGLTGDSKVSSKSAKAVGKAESARAVKSAYPSPIAVEKSLSSLIPIDKQSDFCHRLVLFGREICSARAPKCGACALSKLCPSREG